jgi:hypothetical protein
VLFHIWFCTVRRRNNIKLLDIWIFKITHVIRKETYRVSSSGLLSPRKTQKSVSFVTDAMRDKNSNLVSTCGELAIIKILEADLIVFRVCYTLIVLIKADSLLYNEIRAGMIVSEQMASSF